jgi:dTDP-4-amino-4,6-dideoxygalactose transaminase
VEPNINTLQIDDTLIEQSITSRTRAVMIVHLYGRCAYTGRIKEICTDYGLKLIEDNAQAHGCRFGDRCTGSLGDVAAHSFYPTKNLGAFGDAGAVTTDDDELAELIRILGNYGSSHRYVFDYIGVNSRMDELQAAILDAKLRDLDSINARRREIACIYNKVENPEIRIPKCDRDSIYHIFPVISSRREELRRYMLDNGVETEIHYPIPPNRQKCYRAWNHLSFSITERIHNQELSIPCNQAMKDEDVSMVVDLLSSFS